MRKRKRRGRSEREHGIDDDSDCHGVLYDLRLLDDDDEYDLFCQMVRQEETLGNSQSLKQ